MILAKELERIRLLEKRIGKKFKYRDGDHITRLLGNDFSYCMKKVMHMTMKPKINQRAIQAKHKHHTKSN